MPVVGRSITTINASGQGIGTTGKQSSPQDQEHYIDKPSKVLAKFNSAKSQSTPAEAGKIIAVDNSIFISPRIRNRG